MLRGNSLRGDKMQSILRTRRTEASEALVVKPKAAWKMLACGNTRGYALLAAGELESFLDGRSRKITVESIRDYIARRRGKPGAYTPARSPPAAPKPSA
jgi:hypothetical protein